jgi:putative intracellular protease/amidase
MTAEASKAKGKIGVLVEAHFDEHEYRRFNEFFPANGYQVEYLSHLWGQKELTFRGNDLTEEVTVSVEVNAVDPADYKGIILIGGYAMDRLRYQANPVKGKPNTAPAVEFLRRATKTPGLKIGTICHSLWLYCAAPELLEGKKVTCAHNIICDVEGAGGRVVYNGDETANTHIDGNLITGKHPGVVDEFMEIFLKEIA